MFSKPPEYTGDVVTNLNPQKTARAVQLREIPPLICLVCINSNEKGRCEPTKVDMAMVKARWEKQIVIDPDSHQESVIPDTPLTEICSKFRPED